MLTDRANRFLATLDRYPKVPTSDVQRLLEEGGHPCFEPWLAFHEQYAGYFEPLGNDWAIWGLSHEQTTWRDARAVTVVYDRSSGQCWISCAESHPSYDYTLDNDGLFGGPESAHSFDVKVERNAVRWEFGQSEVLTRELLRDRARLEELLQRLQGRQIAEASDEFFTYYADEHYLVSVTTEARELAFARRRS